MCSLLNLPHRLQTLIKSFNLPKSKLPVLTLLPKSKPTPDDPPQVVEREAEIPDDPNLVAGQKMTEKEQKRIMNEDKNKDSGDPHTLLLDEEDEEEVTKKEWGSGPASVDALRQTGDKDDLESEEDRNEPEQTFLEQIAEAAKKGISKK